MSAWSPQEGRPSSSVEREERHHSFASLFKSNGRCRYFQSRIWGPEIAHSYNGDIRPRTSDHEAVDPGSTVSWWRMCREGARAWSPEPTHVIPCSLAFIPRKPKPTSC